MKHAVFFLSSAAGEERKEQWKPPVDVFRVRGGWLLRFELAGVRLEDIELLVESSILTIRGLRRDYMCLEEGCSFYSMEIAYSRFERRIEMPASLEGSRLSTEYRDGILLVRILQQAGEEPGRIGR